jgi:deoxyribodipyrimidine photo-lyase
VAERSIMWFRRDLRVDDHPALEAACAGGSVLALFVIDPAFALSGTPRRRMLAAALARLDAAIGGALVIRRGDPATVVPAVASEVDAATVFVTKDFGPYGRRRDQAVATALQGAGRALRGVDSPYAVEPGVLRTEADSSYRVFTPFLRRWRTAGLESPRPEPTGVDWLEARSDRSHLPSHEPDSFEWESRWSRFLDGALCDYAAGRNRPDVDGTSRLSPHLRFGSVHPRQLLAALDLTEPNHAAFAAELAWRDFYADVLLRDPDSAWRNLDRRFDALPVDTDASARERFERWARGETGFPIVDAGMRQLVQVGWMHNRVRMITASFLVKDLHLPWQWGARHFMLHLADGDLASNNHGWQWAAGSGTDAAPFFRVFNPTAQLERFDPDRAYVQRWLPELGGNRYPPPMVDHAAERLESLARYDAVRQGRAPGTR